MNQHTLPKAVWKTIVAVFLLMPLVVTVVYTFSARWVHILPEGFTLHYIAAEPEIFTWHRARAAHLLCAGGHH